MISANLAVNPDIFFFFKEGQLYLWDYFRHDQYEVSADHVKVLTDDGFAATRPDLVKELVEGNILVAPSIPKARTAWKWDVLARLFHLGTSSNMTQGGIPDEIQDRTYVRQMADIASEVPPDAFNYRRGEAVAASAPDARPQPNRNADVEAMVRLLARRKSSRAFVQDPLPLGDLGDILRETFGYRAHDEEAFKSRGLETITSRRSSPSGGSLQSCEAYVLSMNVAGLERGIYHYWSAHDQLGRVNELPADYDLGACVWQQDFLNKLSAAIVITCRFDKLWWKYHHSRAYRVGLMDCGHLSQTAQLMATSYGLQTWVGGAFYDSEMSRLLGLPADGGEQPLLVLGLGGKGPASPFKSHWKVEGAAQE